MVPRHPSCPACRRHAEAVGEATWKVLEAWIDEAAAPRDPEPPLHLLLQRFRQILPSRRASLVTPMGDGFLRVVACSDLRYTGDLMISLERYPELLRILETGGAFLAEDVSSSPALAPVARSLERLGIESLMAVPLSMGGVPMIFRLIPAGQPFDTTHLRIAQAAAHLLEHAPAEEPGETPGEGAWRAMAAALCDCILEVLPNGKIAAVHGKPEPVFGRSRSELAGAQAEDLFQVEGAESAGRRLFHLLEALRAREDGSSRATIRSREGGPLQLSVSEIPSLLPRLLVAVARTGPRELSLDDIPAPALLVGEDGILTTNRRARHILRASGGQLDSQLAAESTERITIRGDSGGALEFRVLSRPLAGRHTRLVLLMDARPWTTATQRIETLRTALKQHMSALEDARRHIEDLEVLKSRFLASSAHELKTPLTVLQSYLEILSTDLSEGLNDEQRSFLEIAYRNVLRLRRLVVDLTDLAALEGGQITVEIGRVAMEPILRGVIEDMRPLALDAGLDLRFQVPDDLPDTRADASRVEQVFHNLVDNAVKYTPPGGSITLTGRRRGDSVVIEIRDTGIGIPPGQESAIFEPFVRSGVPPARDRNEGAGLGLTISRKIMSALGGRLSVTSSPGKGSTFRVHLPTWPGEDDTGHD